MPAETHVERSPIGPDDVLAHDPRAPRRDPRDRRGRASPSTPSFADDLDADSLALIELVEALEEELGERTVGLHARRRRPRRPPHRRATRSTTSCTGSARERSRPEEPHERRRSRGAADPDLDARLQLALGWTFADHAPPRPRAHAPLVLRRARHRGVERAARVPRRLACSASSSPTFVYERVPAAARRRAGQAARRRS